jgi:signal transduction histidine kinase
MTLRRWPRPPAPGIAVGRAVGTVAYAVAAIVSVPTHLRWAAVGFTAVALAGALYSWRARTDQPVHRLVGLFVMAGGGHALYAVDPHSPGWFPAGIAISVALAALPLPVAVGFAFVSAGVAATIAELRNPTAVVPLLAGCGGFAILGATLGTSRQRAESAERLLASEKAAREAEARTRVYAERQRLAREIHDILAHTLSAQIVGLESARLLLRRGAGADAVLQQVDQAQRLARDGLEETRRAVHSLRGDARPTLESVRTLAETAGARLSVTGEPQALEPEAGLAVERTVQEALTNVRKHAPGAVATVSLSYLPDRFEVEVRDVGGSGNGAVPADSGAGYGLAGMRERAELLGGKLIAGPLDDGKGYRVWLTIPN